MLLSIWNRLWFKRLIVGAYFLFVVIGSVTFCYWTFKVDTGMEIVATKVLKPQTETSCQFEIEKAKTLFEKDMTPKNWKNWSDLEQGCK